MAEPSWFLLQGEDPTYRLDPRPPDCGWVEQMRPFLRAFSRPGDLVLDPFAGWGTTLVACALEGRRGIGLEIEPDRAHAIRRRVGSSQLVACADSRRPPLAPESVALCLTSIPYFGAPPASAAPGQLYGVEAYPRFLSLLRDVFAATRAALRPGGIVVAMAENVRLPDGRFVPQAWDAARILGELFELREERVICYERSLPADRDPLVTNRAHEYALVARRI